MDKKEFTLEYLFTKYKDHPITPRLIKELAEKYKLDEPQATELRVKLINYQIEYWGEQISTARENPPFDLKRVNQAHIQRKINKRKRLGLNR